MIELKLSRVNQGSRVNRRGFLSATCRVAGPLSLAGSRPANADHDGGRAKSVIQVWLGGGPSQYETYDPKPDAPAEIRGPFRPISTCVSGLHICELLPRQAQLMDRLACIRTLSHENNNHHAAMHWMQTGHYGPPDKTKPEQTRPSIGSVVSALTGATASRLPAYVHLANDPLGEPTLLLNFGSAYLGAKHEPFRIKPARIGEVQAGEGYLDDLTGRPQFDLPAVDLLENVSLDRLESRAELMRQLDSGLRETEARLSVYDDQRRQALDMLVSPRARSAFDLSQENPATRERYGRNMWGQAALLCRRLVESGVRFVTLNTDAYSLAWDSHKALERDYRQMMPWYDRFLTALVEDLISCGLYDQVLLVVAGEFGRTARINGNAGRDHWGPAGVVLIGGAGIPGGCVVGATNDRGDAPLASPVSPGDLWATVYHKLGIDPHHMLPDELGRPIPLLARGEPVRELIG